MGRWPKTGVVVVKKSGGNGHCGRHMHSNPVKEVSRVKKKQKQKTYKRLETTHLKPLASLGATAVMVVGDGLIASVVVVHVVL